METIFGKDMATGKFAKDSSAPLGTEDGDTEDGAANEMGLQMVQKRILVVLLRKGQHLMQDLTRGPRLLKVKRMD